MKTTQLILAAGLFLAGASFTFAGPGANHFQRRLQAPKASPVTSAPGAETACPHCKITTVERPVGPGKVTLRTQKMDCGGCAKMERGEKC